MVDVRNKLWVKAIAWLIVLTFLPEQVAWAVDYNWRGVLQAGALPAVRAASVAPERSVSVKDEASDKAIADAVKDALTQLVGKSATDIKIASDITVHRNYPLSLTEDKLDELHAWMLDPTHNLVTCGALSLTGMLSLMGQRVSPLQIAHNALLIDILSDSLDIYTYNKGKRLESSLYSLEKTAALFGLSLKPFYWSNFELDNKEIAKAINKLIPFIAFVDDDHMVLVKGLSKDALVIEDNGKENILSKLEFQRRFSGYGLLRSTAGTENLDIEILSDEVAKAIRGAKREVYNTYDFDPYFKDPDLTNVYLSFGIGIALSFVAGGLTGGLSSPGFSAAQGLSSVTTGLLVSNISGAASYMAVSQFGWSPTTAQIFGAAVGGFAGGIASPTAFKPGSFLSGVSDSIGSTLTNGLVGMARGAAMGGASALAGKYAGDSVIGKILIPFAASVGTYYATQSLFTWAGLDKPSTMDKQTADDLDLKEPLNTGKFESKYDINTGQWKQVGPGRMVGTESVVVYPSDVNSMGLWDSMKFVFNDKVFQAYALRTLIGNVFEQIAIKALGEDSARYIQGTGSFVGAAASGYILGMGNAGEELKNAVLFGASSLALNLIAGKYDKTTGRNQWGLTQTEMAAISWLGTSFLKAGIETGFNFTGDSLKQGSYKYNETTKKMEFIEDTEASSYEVWKYKVVGDGTMSAFLKNLSGMAPALLTFGFTSPSSTTYQSGVSDWLFLDQTLRISGVTEITANVTYLLKQKDKDGKPVFTSWQDIVDKAGAGTLVRGIDNWFVSYVTTAMSSAAAQNMVDIVNTSYDKIFPAYSKKPEDLVAKLPSGGIILDIIKKQNSTTGNAATVLSTDQNPVTTITSLDGTEIPAILDPTSPMLLPLSGSTTPAPTSDIVIVKWEKGSDGQLHLVSSTPYVPGDTEFPKADLIRAALNAGDVNSGAIYANKTLYDYQRVVAGITDPQVREVFDRLGTALRGNDKTNIEIRAAQGVEGQPASVSADQNLSVLFQSMGIRKGQGVVPQEGQPFITFDDKGKYKDARLWAYELNDGLLAKWFGLGNVDSFTVKGENGIAYRVNPEKTYNVQEFNISGGAAARVAAYKGVVGTYVSQVANKEFSAAYVQGTFANGSFGGITSKVSRYSEALSGWDEAKIGVLMPVFGETGQKILKANAKVSETPGEKGLLPDTFGSTSARLTNVDLQGDTKGLLLHLDTTKDQVVIMEGLPVVPRNSVLRIEKTGDTKLYLGDIGDGGQKLYSNPQGTTYIKFGTQGPKDQAIHFANESEAQKGQREDRIYAQYFKDALLPDQASFPEGSKASLYAKLTEELKGFDQWQVIKKPEVDRDRSVITGASGERLFNLTDGWLEAGGTGRWGVTATVLAGDTGIVKGSVFNTLFPQMSLPVAGNASSQQAQAEKYNGINPGGRFQIGSVPNSDLAAKGLLQLSEGSQVPLGIGKKDEKSPEVLLSILSNVPGIEFSAPQGTVVGNNEIVKGSFATALTLENGSLIQNFKGTAEGTLVKNYQYNTLPATGVKTGASNEPVVLATTADKGQYKLASIYNGTQWQLSAENSESRIMATSGLGDVKTEFINDAGRFFLALKPNKARGEGSLALEAHSFAPYVSEPMSAAALPMGEKLSDAQIKDLAQKATEARQVKLAEVTELKGATIDGQKIDVYTIGLSANPELAKLGKVEATSGYIPVFLSKDATGNVSAQSLIGVPGTQLVASQGTVIADQVAIKNPQGEVVGIGHTVNAEVIGEQFVSTIGLKKIDATTGEITFDYKGTKGIAIGNETGIALRQYYGDTLKPTSLDVHTSTGAYSEPVMLAATADKGQYKLAARYNDGQWQLSAAGSISNIMATTKGLGDVKTEFINDDGRFFLALKPNKASGEGSLGMEARTFAPYINGPMATAELPIGIQLTEAQKKEMAQAAIKAKQIPLKDAIELKGTTINGQKIDVYTIGLSANDTLRDQGQVEVTSGNIPVFLSRDMAGNVTAQSLIGVPGTQLVAPKGVVFADNTPIKNAKGDVVSDHTVNAEVIGEQFVSTIGLKKIDATTGEITFNYAGTKGNENGGVLRNYYERELKPTTVKYIDKDKLVDTAITLQGTFKLAAAYNPGNPEQPWSVSAASSISNIKATTELFPNAVGAHFVYDAKAGLIMTIDPTKDTPLGYYGRQLAEHMAGERHFAKVSQTPAPNQRQKNNGIALEENGYYTFSLGYVEKDFSDAGVVKLVSGHVPVWVGYDASGNIVSQSLATAPGTTLIAPQATVIGNDKIVKGSYVSHIGVDKEGYVTHTFEGTEAGTVIRDYSARAMNTVIKADEKNNTPIRLQGTYKLAVAYDANDKQQPWKLSAQESTNDITASTKWSPNKVPTSFAVDSRAGMILTLNPTKDRFLVYYGRDLQSHMLSFKSDGTSAEQEPYKGTVLGERYGFTGGPDKNLAKHGLVKIIDGSLPVMPIEDDHGNVSAQSLATAPGTTFTALNGTQVGTQEIVKGTYISNIGINGKNFLTHDFADTDATVMDLSKSYHKGSVITVQGHALTVTQIDHVVHPLATIKEGKLMGIDFSLPQGTLLTDKQTGYIYDFRDSKVMLLEIPSSKSPITAGDRTLTPLLAYKMVRGDDGKMRIVDGTKFTDGQGHIFEMRDNKLSTELTFGGENFKIEQLTARKLDPNAATASKFTKYVSSAGKVIWLDEQGKKLDDRRVEELFLNKKGYGLTFYDNGAGVKFNVPSIGSVEEERFAKARNSTRLTLEKTGESVYVPDGSYQKNPAWYKFWTWGGYTAKLDNGQEVKISGDYFPEKYLETMRNAKLKGSMNDGAADKANQPGLATGWISRRGQWVEVAIDETKSLNNPPPVYNCHISNGYYAEFVARDGTTRRWVPPDAILSERGKSYGTPEIMDYTGQGFTNYGGNDWHFELDNGKTLKVGVIDGNQARQIIGSYALDYPEAYSLWKMAGTQNTTTFIQGAVDVGFGIWTAVDVVLAVGGVVTAGGTTVVAGGSEVAKAGARAGVRQIITGVGKELAAKYIGKEGLARFAAYEIGNVAVANVINYALNDQPLSLADDVRVAWGSMLFRGSGVATALNNYGKTLMTQGGTVSNVLGRIIAPLAGEGSALSKVGNVVLSDAVVGGTALTVANVGSKVNTGEWLSWKQNAAILTAVVGGNTARVLTSGVAASAAEGSGWIAKAGTAILTPLNYGVQLGSVGGTVGVVVNAVSTGRNDNGYMANLQSVGQVYIDSAKPLFYTGVIAGIPAGLKAVMPTAASGFMGSVANVFSPKNAISYVTWPAAAVVGRGIYGFATGDTMTAKDAIDIATMATFARFLAGNSSFAKYLTGGQGEGWTMSNIGRFGALAGTGAGINIAKEFGVGYLESMTGWQLGDFASNGITFSDNNLLGKTEAAAFRGAFWAVMGRMVVNDTKAVFSNMGSKFGSLSPQAMKGTQGPGIEGLLDSMKITGAERAAAYGAWGAVKWVPIGTQFPVYTGIYKSVIQTLQTGSMPNGTLFNLESVIPSEGGNVTRTRFVRMFNEYGWGLTGEARGILKNAALQAPLSGVLLNPMIAATMLTKEATAPSSNLRIALRDVLKDSPVIGHAAGLVKIAAAVTLADAGIEWASTRYVGSWKDKETGELIVFKENLPTGFSAKGGGLSERSVASWATLIFGLKPTQILDKGEFAFKEGVAARNQKDYGRAAEQFGIAAEFKPSIENFANLADAQFKNNNFEGAEISLNRAMEISDGKNIGLHTALGAAQYNQGKFSDSAYSFYWASKLAPENVGIHQALAEAQMKAGDFAGSERTYSTALKLSDGKDVNLYTGLATVQFNQGKFSDAVQSLAAASRLEPENVAIQKALGQTQLKAGDSVSAERTFMRALELTDGRDVDIQTGLGTAQYNQGKFSDSAYSFYWASKLAPKNENVLQSLGVAQVRAGDFASANRALDLSAELTSSVPDAAAGTQALKALRLPDSADLGQVENAVKMQRNGLARQIEGTTADIQRLSAKAEGLRAAGKIEEANGLAQRIKLSESKLDKAQARLIELSQIEKSAKEYVARVEQGEFGSSGIVKNTDYMPKERRAIEDAVRTQPAQRIEGAKIHGLDVVALQGTSEGYITGKHRAYVDLETGTLFVAKNFWENPMRSNAASEIGMEFSRIQDAAKGYSDLIQKARENNEVMSGKINVRDFIESKLLDIVATQKTDMGLEPINASLMLNEIKQGVIATQRQVDLIQTFQGKLSEAKTAKDVRIAIEEMGGGGKTFIDTTMLPSLVAKNKELGGMTALTTYGDSLSWDLAQRSSFIYGDKLGEIRYTNRPSSHALKNFGDYIEVMAFDSFTNIFHAQKHAEKTGELTLSGFDRSKLKNSVFLIDEAHTIGILPGIREGKGTEIILSDRAELESLRLTVRSLENETGLSGAKAWETMQKDAPKVTPGEYARSLEGTKVDAAQMKIAQLADGYSRVREYEMFSNAQARGEMYKASISDARPLAELARVEQQLNTGTPSFTEASLKASQEVAAKTQQATQELRTRVAQRIETVKAQEPAKYGRMSDLEVRQNILGEKQGQLLGRTYSDILGSSYYRSKYADMLADARGEITQIEKTRALTREQAETAYLGKVVLEGATRAAQYSGNEYAITQYNIEVLAGSGKADARLHLPMGEMQALQIKWNKPLTRPLGDTKDITRSFDALAEIGGGLMLTATLAKGSIAEKKLAELQYQFPDRGNKPADINVNKPGQLAADAKEMYRQMYENMVGGQVTAGEITRMEKTTGLKGAEALETMKQKAPEVKPGQYYDFVRKNLEGTTVGFKEASTQLKVAKLADAFSYFDNAGQFALFGGHRQVREYSQYMEKVHDVQRVRGLYDEGREAQTGMSSVRGENLVFGPTMPDKIEATQMKGVSSALSPVRLVSGTAAQIGTGIDISWADGAISKKALHLAYPEEITKPEMIQAFNRILGNRGIGMNPEVWIYTNAEKLDNTPTFSSFKPKDGQWTTGTWSDNLHTVQFSNELFRTELATVSPYTRQTVSSEISETNGTRGSPKTVEELATRLVESKIIPEVEKPQFIETFQKTHQGTLIQPDGTFNEKGMAVADLSLKVLEGTPAQQNNFTAAISTLNPGQGQIVSPVAGTFSSPTGISQTATAIQQLSSQGVLSLNDDGLSLSSFIQYGQLASVAPEKFSGRVAPEDLVRAIGYTRTDSVPYHFANVLVNSLPVGDAFRKEVAPLIKGQEEAYKAVNVAINDTTRTERAPSAAAQQKVTKAVVAFENAMPTMGKLNEVAVSLPGAHAEDLIPWFTSHLQNTTAVSDTLGGGVYNLKRLNIPMAKMTPDKIVSLSTSFAASEVARSLPKADSASDIAKLARTLDRFERTRVRLTLLQRMGHADLSTVSDEAIQKIASNGQLFDRFVEPVGKKQQLMSLAPSGRIRLVSQAISDLKQDVATLAQQKITVDTEKGLTPAAMLMIGRSLAQAKGLQSPAETNALARNLANDAVLLYAGLGSAPAVSRGFDQFVASGTGAIDYARTQQKGLSDVLFRLDQKSQQIVAATGDLARLSEQQRDWYFAEMETVQKLREEASVGKVDLPALQAKLDNWESEVRPIASEAYAKRTKLAAIGVETPQYFQMQDRLLQGKLIEQAEVEKNITRAFDKGIASVTRNSGLTNLYQQYASAGRKYNPEGLHSKIVRDYFQPVLAYEREKSKVFETVFKETPQASIAPDLSLLTSQGTAVNNVSRIQLPTVNFEALQSPLWQNQGIREAFTSTLQAQTYEYIGMVHQGINTLKQRLVPEAQPLTEEQGYLQARTQTALGTIGTILHGEPHWTLLDKVARVEALSQVPELLPQQLFDRREAAKQETTKILTDVSTTLPSVIKSGVNRELGKDLVTDEMVQSVARDVLRRLQIKIRVPEGLRSVGLAETVGTRGQYSLDLNIKMINQQDALFTPYMSGVVLSHEFAHMIKDTLSHELLSRSQELGLTQEQIKAIEGWQIGKLSNERGIDTDVVQHLGVLISKQDQLSQQLIQDKDIQKTVENIPGIASVTDIPLISRDDLFSRIEKTHGIVEFEMAKYPKFEIGKIVGNEGASMDIPGQTGIQQRMEDTMSQPQELPLLALGHLKLNGSPAINVAVNPKSNDLVLRGNGTEVSIPVLKAAESGVTLEGRLFGATEDYSVRFLNGTRNQWVVTQNLPAQGDMGARSEIIARFEIPITGATSPLALPTGLQNVLGSLEAMKNKEEATVRTLATMAPAVSSPITWNNVSRKPADLATQNFVKIDDVYYVPTSVKSSFARIASQSKMPAPQVEAAAFDMMGIPQGSKVVYLSDGGFNKAAGQNLELQYGSHPILALYSIGEVAKTPAPKKQVAYVFGAGAGVLAARLALDQNISKVVAIEKDPKQLRLLDETIKANPKLKIEKVTGSFENYIAQHQTEIKQTQPIFVANLPERDSAGQPSAASLFKSLAPVLNDQAFVAQVKPVIIFSGIVSENTNLTQQRSVIADLAKPYSLDVRGLELADVPFSATRPSPFRSLGFVAQAAPSAAVSSPVFAISNISGRENRFSVTGQQLAGRTFYMDWTGDRNEDINIVPVMEDTTAGPQRIGTIQYKENIRSTSQSALNSIEIQAIGLQEPYRQGGIGTETLKLFVNEARRAGMGSVELKAVEKANVPVFQQMLDNKLGLPVDVEIKGQWVPLQGQGFTQELPASVNLRARVEGTPSIQAPSSPIEQIRYQRTLPAVEVFKALELNKQDTYLNLAGGPGTYTAAASAQGIKQAIYLDISSKNLPMVEELLKFANNPQVAASQEMQKLSTRPMVNVATELPKLRAAYAPAPAIPANTSVLRADATKIPLADSSVTKLSVTDLFNWAGEASVMKEAIRVTAPQGLMYVKHDFINSDKNIEKIEAFKNRTIELASAQGARLEVKAIEPSGAIVFKVTEKIQPAQAMSSAVSSPVSNFKINKASVDDFAQLLTEIGFARSLPKHTVMATAEKMQALAQQATLTKENLSSKLSTSEVKELRDLTPFAGEISRMANFEPAPQVLSRELASLRFEYAAGKGLDLGQLIVNGVQAQPLGGGKWAGVFAMPARPDLAVRVIKGGVGTFGTEASVQNQMASIGAVAPAYASGRIGQHGYIVMQKIDAPTVKELVEQGAFDAADLAAVNKLKDTLIQNGWRVNDFSINKVMVQTNPVTQEKQAYLVNARMAKNVSGDKQELTMQKG